MTDAIRYFALALAATTYGWAIANLVVAWMVLRPHPFTWENIKGKGGGFIWFHILLMVVGFQSAMTSLVFEMVSRFGGPMTYRPILIIYLSILIDLGYLVIFRVELGRLRLIHGGLGDIRVSSVRSSDVG